MNQRFVMRKTEVKLLEFVWPEVKRASASRYACCYYAEGVDNYRDAILSACQVDF